ncbi:MAG: hypothetical protein ABIL05_02830 [candidate division WOR-3 bacterium]
MGQGRDAVIEFLKTNSDIALSIEQKVREALHLPYHGDNRHKGSEKK